MSTPALSPPVAAPGRHHRVPSSMSTMSWGHVRAGLTATIVVAATVAGIVVGLGGATVSPVSVSVSGTTVTSATDPVITTGPGPTADGDGAHRDHHHR